MPRRDRPDPLAQSIGRRLRKLRQEKGLTAEKVAYESDVGSKGFVSDIENGLALPSLRTLERLASYLEVELFDLVVQPESGPRAALLDKSRALATAELEQLLRQIASLPRGIESTVARPPLHAVRAYPALEVAAGWTRAANASSRTSAEYVRLPGSFERSRDFAVRATGTSMQGWRSEIRHGDWLVLRWANMSLRAADGRVALIAREDRYGDRSLHLKRIACSANRIQLRSDEPSVSSVIATESDSVLALLRNVVRPEALAPEPNGEFPERSVARAFGVRTAPKPPYSRIDGHLFVFARTSDTVSSGVAVKVPDLHPGETAFILQKVATGIRYLGVAHFDDDRGRWALRPKP